MSYDISPFGWSLEDTVNAFDSVDAPWYYFGVGQQGPLVCVRDRNEVVYWENPNSLTTEMTYGRQRPMVVLSYFLMNGLPIYHAMGSKTFSVDKHIFSFIDRTSHLPKYQIRYQNSDAISNTIWEMYNCKTHSLTLSISRDNPMMASEIILGTDRWISNSSTWLDNTTQAYGYNGLMYDPILYTGTDTVGFYLDSNSVVNVGESGSEVNITQFLHSFQIHFSLLPVFVYSRGNSFREELFPSDIYETHPIVPSSVDIDLVQGVDISLVKDILTDNEINISAKFYSDATHYIKIDCTSSKYTEGYVSVFDPFKHQTRILRMRFMCDYSTTVEVNDGVTSIEAHQ